MTEKDIERKAIKEILKETEIIKEREKPPENRFCINKRLLSRNLVSTLRNPVFPRNLNRRTVIGLDDETEDESDDDNRRKSSSRQNRFADDDFIYDARDYFNPEKYREIVAYRNKKRQRQESYERKRFSGYVGDSVYVPDSRKYNYYDDNLQYRELQDYANEELEADAMNEKGRIKLLTNSSTSLCVVENTDDVGACTGSHRKRKHHKSKVKKSQEKTNSRKLKHKQDKLECTYKDKDKKCEQQSTHIKKSRHKKKKRKKQKKKSAYNSDIEFEELNQLEVEDFSKFRSDCIENATSPYSICFGNENSGSSMQHNLGYGDNLINHRLGEADCSFKEEQFLNGSEDVSYEGSSLVSAKYLNELYFRTRHNSDNGESSVHSVDSVSCKQIDCSDVVLDNASDHSEGSVYCDDYEIK